MAVRRRVLQIGKVSMILIIILIDNVMIINFINKLT